MTINIKLVQGGQVLSYNEQKFHNNDECVGLEDIDTTSSTSSFAGTFDSLLEGCTYCRGGHIDDEDVKLVKSKMNGIYSVECDFLGFFLF